MKAQRRRVPVAVTVDVPAEVMAAQREGDAGMRWPDIRISFRFDV